MLRIFSVWIVITILPSCSDTLIWQNLSESLARASMLKTANNMRSFLRDQFINNAANSRHCLVPGNIMSTRYMGPCKIIKVTWKDKRYSVVHEVTVWNNYMGDDRFFSTNISLIELNLTPSLHGCPYESVVLTYFRQNETIVFPTLCGVRGKRDIFINQTKFDITYTISRLVSSLRFRGSKALAAQRGNFRIHLQVYNKLDLNGEIPWRPLYIDDIVRKVDMDTNIAFLEFRGQTFTASLTKLQFYSTRIAMHTNFVITSVIGYVLQITTTVGTFCKARYTIYDGPDSQSQFLQGAPHYDRSSGHVVSVFAHVDLMPRSCRRGIINHLLKNRIEFKLVDIPKYEWLNMEIKNKRKYLHIPGFNNTRCTKFCHLMFWTKPGKFLEVSITHATMSGPNPFCVHRGLYVFTDYNLNVKLHFFKQIFHLCDTQLGELNGMIDERIMASKFTSDNNVVYVMWFSYPGSFLSVSITVKVAECAGGFLFCDSIVMKPWATGEHCRKPAVYINQKPEEIDPFEEYNHDKRLSIFILKRTFDRSGTSELITEDCIRQRKKEVIYRRLYSGVQRMKEHFFNNISKEVDWKKCFFNREGRNAGNCSAVTKTTMSINTKVSCLTIQYLGNIDGDAKSRKCHLELDPFHVINGSSSSIESLKTIYENCTDRQSHELSLKIPRGLNFSTNCTQLRLHIVRSNVETVDLDINSYGLFERYIPSTFYLTGTNKTLTLYSSSDSNSAILLSSQWKYTKQNVGYLTSKPMQMNIANSFYDNSLLNLLNYFTTITVSVDGKAKSTFYLDIYLFVRSIYNFDHFKKIRLIPLQRSSWLIKDFLTFEKRIIVLSGTINGSDSENVTVQVKTTADKLINDEIKNHYILDSLYMKTGGSLVNLTDEMIDSIYYVIWLTAEQENEIATQSWNEANRFCSEKGGSLPTIHSDADISLIKNLILGTRFGSDHLPFMSPGRIYYDTIIFIGFVYNKIMWSNGQPVTLTMFSTMFPYTHYDTPNYNSRFDTRNLDVHHLCTGAILNKEGKIQWIYILCDEKLPAPTLICQNKMQKTTTDVRMRHLVIYFLSDWLRYPWFLESCYGKYVKSRADIGGSVYRNNNYIVRRIRYLETVFPCLQKPGHDPTDCASNSFIRTKVRYGHLLDSVTNGTRLITHSIEKYLKGICKKNNYRTCGHINICINMISEAGEPHMPSHSTGFKFIPTRIMCNIQQVLVHNQCLDVQQWTTLSMGQNKSSLTSPKALNRFVATSEYRMLFHAYFKCHNKEYVNAKSIRKGAFQCLDKSDRYCLSQYCDQKNSSLIELPCSQYGFRCENGKCIQKHHFCDGIADCKQSEDEKFCPYLSKGSRARKMQKVQNYQLFPTDCHRNKVIGEQWYIKDGIIHCPSVYVITDYESIGNITSLNNVAFFSLDEDGTDILVSQSKPCSQPNHIPCRYSFQFTCFPFERLCVFDLDEYGRARFCSNGGHLSQCAGVHCQGFYKCPRSYCLPLWKVCNGIEDCLYGEDETECPLGVSVILPCPGMLRCSRSCVDPLHVCDGITDCQELGEDEWDCDMAECPVNCSCVGTSVFCDSNHIQATNVTGFTSIAIRKSKMQNAFLYGIDMIYLLTIQNCDGFELRESIINSGNRIIHLELTFNHLSQLSTSISVLPFLKFLNLSNNYVKSLHEDFLEKIPNVIDIDLSSNKLIEIDFHILSNLKHLSVLSVRNNRIKTVFLPSSEHIRFKRFSLLGNKVKSIRNPIEDSMTTLLHVQELLTSSAQICYVIEPDFCPHAEEPLPHYLINSKLGMRYFCSASGIILFLLSTTYAILKFISETKNKSTASRGKKALRHLQLCCKYCISLRLFFLEYKNSLIDKDIIFYDDSPVAFFCLIFSLLEYWAIVTFIYSHTIELYVLSSLLVDWTKMVQQISFISPLVHLVWSILLLFVLGITVISQKLVSDDFIDFGQFCSVVSMKNVERVASAIFLLIFFCFCTGVLVTANGWLLLKTTKAVYISQKEMSALMDVKRNLKFRRVAKNLLFQFALPSIVSFSSFIFALLPLYQVPIVNSAKMTITAFVFPLPVYIVSIYQLYSFWKSIHSKNKRDNFLKRSMHSKGVK